MIITSAIRINDCDFKEMRMKVGQSLEVNFPKASYIVFLAGANGVDFELIAPGKDWRRVTGQELDPVGADLQLTPARHGTDGFYVAIMRRRVG